MNRTGRGSGGTEKRASAAAAASSRRRSLALIADDDETTRLVLHHALTRLGYTAFPVDDGGEIWPVLDREDVSALILDLNMPGMNGWEVLRRFRDDFRYRDKRRRIRIVILSAQSDRTSRDFVHSLGADAFLPKPLDLDALSRALGYGSFR
jgi:CheY-like chemotaxis protein